jgi:hypothetical protein
MDAQVIATPIMQLVTMALVVYWGLQLRRRLQTLQATVEAQQATIDAQVAQLQAQRLVLQDFERLTMSRKLTFESFSEPADLPPEARKAERWNLYLPRWVRQAVEAEATALERAPSQVLQAIVRQWLGAQ